MSEKWIKSRQAIDQKHRDTYSDGQMQTREEDYQTF